MQVWLPQLAVAAVLVTTGLLSHLSAPHGGKRTLYGDVFVLTTIEKLTVIGYNAHLIVFITSRADIDIAYMVLPLAVFIFYIIGKP